MELSTPGGYGRRFSRAHSVVVPSVLRVSPGYGGSKAVIRVGKNAIRIRGGSAKNLTFARRNDDSSLIHYIYIYYLMRLRLTLTLLSLALATAAAGASDIPEADSVRHNYHLGEVVVTGARQATDVRHLPMTVSVVGRTQLEGRYQPSLLPALAEQVPGLFVTSRGVLGYGVSTGAAGGLSLRGLSGSAQMLVLIDGHPQYMGLFGHPISDSYQTMLAERVEVLRGPASVLYGSNAMGGVINIVTRRMPGDGVKTDLNVGAGSYGTVQAEAVNRVRRGRFGSTAAFSYNRTDGHRADMPFEQFSGYAKLSYDLSRQWRLWGDVNVTHFTASNPGETFAPLVDNDSRITRGMASAMLENSYDRTSGALSFFYNWGKHRINDGYSPGDEPQDELFRSKDVMMGVSWYQSAELWRGNRLTVGVDYQHFGGELWNVAVADGARIPGVEKTQDEVAAYADFRQDVGRWLSIDAGLRVDHHSHVGTELVPQGGLAFHLPRQAELKAMASKGFRNPTVREMYMFPPQNPGLRPERLVNYELSFTQSHLDGALSYGANLFCIDGENLIVTTRQDGRPLNVNSGEIKNWGMEAQAAWRVNPRWSVQANYSWVHMEHPVISAPEHKLYAGADFHQGRWAVSTGVQYVGGLYTSVGDAPTTEDFVLWNARATYRLCPCARLFVRGENLLGQRYEVMRGYPMPKATFLGGVSVSF